MDTGRLPNRARNCHRLGPDAPRRVSHLGPRRPPRVVTKNPLHHAQRRPIAGIESVRPLALHRQRQEIHPRPQGRDEDDRKAELSCTAQRCRRSFFEAQLAGSRSRAPHGRLLFVVVARTLEPRPSIRLGLELGQAPLGHLSLFFSTPRRPHRHPSPSYAFRSRPATFRCLFSPVSAAFIMPRPGLNLDAFSPFIYRPA